MYVQEIKNFFPVRCQKLDLSEHASTGILVFCSSFILENSLILFFVLFLKHRLPNYLSRISDRIHETCPDLRFQRHMRCLSFYYSRQLLSFRVSAVDTTITFQPRLLKKKLPFPPIFFSDEMNLSPWLFS